MKSMSWQKAIESSADPERAQRYLEQLKETVPAAWFKKASPEQIHICISLFAGSQALGDLLLQDTTALSLLEPGKLGFPRQKQGLRREVDAFLKPALASASHAEGLTRIRQFKQREMLRIGARDLARLAGMVEVVQELSDLADVCLHATFQICWQQLTARFGVPYHRGIDEGWEESAFSVLGMGKLGGWELNYSSDVDLLFVYSDEGHVFKTPPRRTDAGKGMTNHQFFIRLAEAMVGEVNRVTGDGFLFRVDMRLRPEGNAGPLARSLDSYENFYAQWGQIWERMMLIKARCTAGDQELAHEFLEMIQPFRYPRSIMQRVLREIAATKERIENEIVGPGEIERDVKRGRGGIREIEFIAQALQVLHAGKNPFLQGPQTLPTLQKLVEYKLLTESDEEELSSAYIFLRDLEHRLQMEANQQTHTIPTERKSRERLARLMGFPALKEFESAKASHCDNVRRIYEKLLKNEGPASPQLLPAGFEDEKAWTKLLADHAFQDPGKALRLIREFVEGPGYVHVSPRTSELARELLPKFLGLCPAAQFPAAEPKLGVLSDPDRVVARLDSFIAAYGARAVLYEVWTTHPSLFALLLMLFDRSEFLAEIAIRDPGLVDELEASGRLRRSKTATETLEDLRHGHEDEDQKLWIRRYFKAEFMRIGLRDILGLADFEQNTVELSALADACLQYALEVVTRKNKLKATPFCIIGLGKLGGREVTYGSDLDIVFVAAPKVKNLPVLQKLAAEIMDLLSAPTEQGIVFLTDARLRPDGEKGLLVNTLKAYEEYYRNRAQLWEIQALTRIRPVAGDMEIGEQFSSMAAALTNFRTPSLPLAAYTSEWKKEIARMRQRIEKERTPKGKDELAIKTGIGGLMDAEFVAQVWCLENGWQEPNTLRALEWGRKKQILTAEEAEQLITNFRKLRRIESILRRWSYEGETELPDDPAPMYRVAVRCGFKNAADFLREVRKWRSAIREVSLRVLPFVPK